ncbi:MAG: hypothetical protein R3320_00760 [Nitriliruptorales bacterium]|nr:hypothetical protein [Nitriliruptorales bacterium]
MGVMLATAVTSGVAPWWWGALAAGLVVAVVLVVLLHSLLRRVHEIEDGANQIWHTGKLVARNTATVWMLNTTAEAADEIAAEATRHAELLKSKGS